MSGQSTQETGRFVWHDLMTTDLDLSVPFYKALFGWTTSQQDMGPMGTYTVVQLQGQPIGGMVPMEESHGLPSHWISYLTVDDVDALCERMQELGGTVAVAPRGIPGIGRFAIARDPSGAIFSPFQVSGDVFPKREARPTHGMFCWNQLLTKDTNAAEKFYGEVCGWTVEKHDMGSRGTYGIFKREGENAGAMLPMEASEVGSPAWLLYVAVDDVDASAAKIDELSGKVIVGPGDIPSVGRFAIATDPAGGLFGVFKSARG